MNSEITDFFSPFSQQKRSLLILGAGLTGTALADFLVRYRIPFFLYDQKPHILSEKQKEWNPYLKRIWDESSFADLQQNLSQFTDILLSPGFPRKNSLVVAAERYARVWNDIDFFYPLLEKSGAILIAITGTDGKSTTVELIRHILGDTALACGNNDIPLVEVLEKILSPDVYQIYQVVIELSSFMLEKIYRFRAHYSAILNIAPDHLNRYQDFSAYTEAKHHLLDNSLPTDTYLYNRDCPETAPRNSTPRTISYSVKENSDYCLQEGRYYFNGNTCVLDGGKTPKAIFPGNIFPALIIARELGIKDSVIQSRFSSFSGLSHRLEMIIETEAQNGKRIFVYNNSKATTLQATSTSIDYLYNLYKTPICIIMGGSIKNTDFTPLANFINKVNAYFYGEAGKIIRKQSGLSGDYFYDMKKCVIRALSDIKRSGGILVLAPACASFDQFESYQERGDFFKKIVKECL